MPRIEPKATAFTMSAIEIPPQVVAVPITPEFIRLPQPKHHCLYTGMGRSALNALILPCEQNGHKPPVKSYVLRQKGAKTGIRLIDYRSLCAHIRANQEEAFQEPQKENTK